MQFNGPGLAVAQIAALHRRLPPLAGVKIETVPAGPKYSAVRQACGPGFWISGGWAIGQMIEALDRGVDAMIPESSMIRVYKAIGRAHREGCGSEAVALFRELLPVLAFTNQDLATSVAFFKRLLVRKGLFASSAQRLPLAGWDATSEHVAAELIDHYLALETRVASCPGGAVPCQTRSAPWKPRGTAGPGRGHPPVRRSTEPAFLQSGEKGGIYLLEPKSI